MTKEEEKSHLEAERDKKVASAKESILVAAKKEATQSFCGTRLINAVHELERVEKEYAIILKELSPPSSKAEVSNQ
jgi:hypothetical protein